MYNLNHLERETWADRIKAGRNEMIEGNRQKLFQLLGVPKNVMEQFLFSKQIAEVHGKYRTFESLRQFSSLPKWLKNRMKYRLQHISDVPEFEQFVTNL